MGCIKLEHIEKEALGTSKQNFKVLKGKSPLYAKSALNYSPFGMIQPGRATNPGSYRFGYNSMEMDNEVSGNGNSYTTEFRQYDPRLGRWKSLDPLMHMFPHMSPYVAFADNPIVYTDPKGLAPINGGGGKTKYDSGTTSAGSFCSSCGGRRSTREEVGVGGMALNVPSSYNQKMDAGIWSTSVESTVDYFKDEDGNGYLNNPKTGVKYKGAEIGQVRSFIGQDQKRYTARFDGSGNFLGYYNGGTKYDNQKVTDDDIVQDYLEEALEYFGADNPSDTPPKVEHNMSITNSDGTFTLGDQTFEGEILLNMTNRSTWEPRLKTTLGDTYTNQFQFTRLDEDPNGNFGSTFTNGYKFKIFSYVGAEWMKYDEIIVVTFSKKSEYIRFVKYIMENYGISDTTSDDFYYEKSIKPSELLGN